MFSIRWDKLNSSQSFCMWVGGHCSDFILVRRVTCRCLCSISQSHLGHALQLEHLRSRTRSGPPGLLYILTSYGKICCNITSCATSVTLLLQSLRGRAFSIQLLTLKNNGGNGYYELYTNTSTFLRNNKWSRILIFQISTWLIHQGPPNGTPGMTCCHLWLPVKCSKYLHVCLISHQTFKPMTLVYKLILRMIKPQKLAWSLGLTTLASWSVIVNRTVYDRPHPLPFIPIVYIYRIKTTFDLHRRWTYRVHTCMGDYPL